MEFYEHFTISAIAAIPAIYLIYGFISPVFFVPLWIAAIGFGTLIDLDHFVIAFIRDKNFKELKLALKNPKTVLKNNNQALDNLIPNWSRYVSHFIILAIIPAFLSAFNQDLSLLAFSMLGLHILCDIYRNSRNLIEKRYRVQS